MPTSLIFWLILSLQVRVDYEKRLKRLEDFCKSSDETNATLQQILSLQEDEYYDRVVARKDRSLKPSTLYQINFSCLFENLLGGRIL